MWNFSSVWVQLRPQVGLSLYFMLITSAIVVVGAAGRRRGWRAAACGGPEEASRRQHRQHRLCKIPDWNWVVSKGKLSSFRRVGGTAIKSIVYIPSKEGRSGVWACHAWGSGIGKPARFTHKNFSWFPPLGKILLAAGSDNFAPYFSFPPLLEDFAYIAKMLLHLQSILKSHPHVCMYLTAAAGPNPRNCPSENVWSSQPSRTDVGPQRPGGMQAWTGTLHHSRLLEPWRGHHHHSTTITERRRSGGVACGSISSRSVKTPQIENRSHGRCGLRHILGVKFFTRNST